MSVDMAKAGWTQRPEESARRRIEADRACIICGLVEENGEPVYLDPSSFCFWCRNPDKWNSVVVPERWEDDEEWRACHAAQFRDRLYALKAAMYVAGARSRMGILHMPPRPR